ncbi:WGR domain-containing protein [Rubellimicrobium roseum]|uniref:WGR domain-containing protein n=1 Tax=Rubellimicrobium roseum TaxID=687525 RepID=A0A5C4N7Y1_9RHOB|nr:WGR domain-containing protein [Rubellimicrobium roseum]TNC60028.1 WGR domain-containing protein [Rubellimicrobium roseum]
MSRTKHTSRESEQLDQLDWIAAAKEVRAAPAPPRTVEAPAQVASGDGPAPVLLTRVDASCNMRRFYGLALAQSLWGEWGVVRHWGRIGAQGQKRTDWYEAPEAARAELERMARHKRRRGYG